MGGCDGSDTLCAEGSGSAAAVGEAAEVHGAAGALLERKRSSWRGRVSGFTGNNWIHVYTTYRRGAVVGVVAPLDRLAVREISGRFLSQDVRVEIACLRRAGLSVREVARQLDRAPSTLSRELRRNALRGGYRPLEAYRRATLRRGDVSAGHEP
jgi:hypothetical protein